VYIVERGDSSVPITDIYIYTVGVGRIRVAVGMRDPCGSVVGAVHVGLMLAAIHIVG
jgi:hypothetical protein